MAMLNIGRDNADASYRYKMPALVTKIEGRGNGIKTVIVNMVDVSKALHIHPAYPTKYFGIELGAQSKFNMATERAIVNGSHTQPDLQKSLEKFIQTFILCPNCKLPEIKMTISEKKGTITIKCDACGYNELLKTPHKLSQYILKNPPKSFEDKKDGGKKKKTKDDEKDEAEEKDDEEDDGSKEKKKKKKKEKEADSESSSSGKEKEKKKKKKVKTEDGDAAEEEKEEDSEEKEKKKKEKKEKKKKEKTEKAGEEDKAETSSAAAAAPAVSGAAKDEKKPEDGWFSDTSAEAQRARKEAEFAELGKTASGDRISKSADVDAILNAAKTKQTEGSPVTLLKVYIASAASEKPRLPVEIVAEVKRIGLARALDEPQKMKVLLEALVDADQPKTAKSVFEKSAPILKLVATDKNSATILLNCVEDLVGVTAPKLVSYTAHILQALYENDVVEEDVLLAWHQLPPESSWLTNKEVAATVRAKAEPFIKWLAEAEEEEDD